MYQCKCSCGATPKVALERLNAGITRSCGCLQAEITKKRSSIHLHNQVGKRSKAYRAWAHMRQRCQNKNDRSYPDYGGRGIKVCERWESFTNFLEDMGEPKENESIDRIDNEGNYEPGNCRWTNKHTQVRNTRRNVFIEMNGERMCVEDWGRKLMIDPETIRARIKRGWNGERALLTPVKQQKARAK